MCSSRHSIRRSGCNIAAMGETGAASDLPAGLGMFVEAASAALGSIDRQGMVLATNSFAHKRAAKSRRPHH